MGPEEILVTEFGRHASFGYNELWNDHELVRYLLEVFFIGYILILFILAFLWFTSTDR